MPSVHLGVFGVHVCLKNVAYYDLRRVKQLFSFIVGFFGEKKLQIIGDNCRTE